MVRKIKAKLVLQLRNQSLSRRAIESAHGISRHSIQAVLDAAELAGLGWDDVAELSEAEVYSALFPGRGVRESVFEHPDWARVHTELARVGVTLKLLHQEYVEASSRAGQAVMSYDRFCQLYGEHAALSGASSRVGHKAGRSIEIDWSGPRWPCWIRRRVSFRRCIYSAPVCPSVGMRSWKGAWICGSSRGCGPMWRCSPSSAAASRVWCPTTT